MLREDIPEIADRVDDRIGVALMAQMLAHKIDNPSPVIRPAFLVNPSVPDDGKLAWPGRNKNQHAVTIGRSLHSEPLKFLLRSEQRSDLQFAALNVNANLG